MISYLGAWPSEGGEAPSAEFVARIQEYIRKAAKEANTHTTWIHPSAGYDSAM